MSHAPIQMLWIGATLPPMQRMCLQSFVAHGHPVHLYAYEAIDGVPPGVTLCDARAIAPPSDIFSYQSGFGQGSVSAFSNVFRYRLLRDRGGWWCDTDVVCLKPFDTADPYVFATEHEYVDGHPIAFPRMTSSCVLRVPAGAPIMDYCVDVCASKNPADVVWAEIGPRLMHDAVNRHGLQPHRHPPQHFNPIDAWAVADLLAPDFDETRLTDAYALHLWHQSWHEGGHDPQRDPHPESLYGRLQAWYLAEASASRPWRISSISSGPATKRPPADRPATSVRHRAMRHIRAENGNAAHLYYPPDNPTVVRVEIDASVSTARHDTQLNLPDYEATIGQRLVLTFMARSDAVRTLGVGFARCRSPWSNLGLYEQIECEPVWKFFALPFAVTGDDDYARVHFDLGASDVSVDLSEVRLYDLERGSPFGATASPQENVAVRTPLPGGVDFGSFRRVSPIGAEFGYQRGRPIDRHYIERFLAEHALDIRGRVLEIGDRTYTRRFGGARVSHSDVLHVTQGHPDATLIGDLSDAPQLPSGAFDCIILTQTLQLIYDVRAAIHTLHRLLRPDGVVLATFPGVTQTYDREWQGQWYWSFTAQSASRLFGDVFGPRHLRIQTFGNVLAATGFLHGLSVDEVTVEELDMTDEAYPLIVAVRAQCP